MKKLLVSLLLIVNAAFLPATAQSAAQDENFKAGVHYKELGLPASGSADNVEVLEFFWYGCPHCYTFEPYINGWKKTMPAGVSFSRVPAIFRPDWEVQARTYYALSNMGVIEDIHGKIFSAMHKDKKRLDKKDLLIDFVVSNGVDRNKFLEEYKSFSVDSMVRKSKKKQTAYQIQGVPSLVINGKYLTSGSMAGSYDNMVKIINHLIAKEKAAK